MLGRVSPLLLLALAALGACTGDGADEPAVSGAGATSAAFPMGAVGAVGVSFPALAASADADPTTPPAHAPKVRSGPRSSPPPIDPFADPPELPADAGAHRPRHAPGGTAL